MADAKPHMEQTDPGSMVFKAIATHFYGMVYRCIFKQKVSWWGVAQAELSPTTAPPLAASNAALHCIAGVSGAPHVM